MSGEIKCEEDGTCKLSTNFSKMNESLPSDLIPLESFTSPTSVELKSRKQIKGNSGSRKVSTKVHSQKRGRMSKQVKPKNKKVRKIKKLIIKVQRKKKIVSTKGRQILKPKKGKQKTR